jgi:hypothetical protein
VAAGRQLVLTEHNHLRQPGAAGVPPVPAQAVQRRYEFIVHHSGAHSDQAGD